MQTCMLFDEWFHVRCVEEIGRREKSADLHADYLAYIHARGYGDSNGKAGAKSIVQCLMARGYARARDGRARYVVGLRLLPPDPAMTNLQLHTATPAPRPENPLVVALRRIAVDDWLTIDKARDIAREALAPIQGRGPIY